MRYIFKIGICQIIINIDKKIAWDENMAKFSTNKIDDSLHKIEYNITLTNEIKSPKEDIIINSDRVLVFSDGKRETRLFRENISEPFFATHEEISENKINIQIKEGYNSVFERSIEIINLLGIEKYFSNMNMFILHSSYIICEDQAILFTAPSGTGKSTHTDLWSKYYGTSIINGDRSIVYLKDNKWYVGGFPLCGSSNHCENKSAPLRSIVYLAQGKQNSLKKLTGFEAIKYIFSEITTNFWNENCIDNTIDLLKKCTDDIDIYHFKCTKYKDAAYTIHDELF